MGIIFMDSFNHYNTSGIYDKYSVGDFNITLAGGRDGVGSYGGTGLSGEMTVSTNNTRYNEAVMSFAGNGNFATIGSLSASMTCVTPGPITYGVATLIIDSVGDIHFTYDPSTGSFVASNFASRKWPLAQWVHVSFKITLTSTTCRGRIYLNEELILDETLSGWSAETVLGVNRFKIHRGMGVCDYYITDGDVYGDLIIGVIRPDGDDSVAFSRSTGAQNYANVDDALVDGDSTYNYASAAATKDIFTMQDVDSAITIYGCQAVMAARKVNAGGATLKMIWKPTTTEFADADFYPSYNQYLYNRVVRNVNPDTGIAWTPSEVNALKMGYEKVL